MKAEVNKTVEVVLRLSEAEAKCLREIARVITIHDNDISRNPNSVAGPVLKNMDEELFILIENLLYKEGLGR